MTYNAELENCLIAIARKHAPQLVPAGWRRPGDLAQPVHRFAESLRAQGVLIVIGDKFDHTDESIIGAARDCVALYRRLYQNLAARLFPYTYAGAETNATLCPASDFVVLAINAPAGPIVDAIDHLVTPFVVRHHAPLLPTRPALRQLAGRILRYLESEQHCAEVADEIADLVEALCAMALRPLPFSPAHSPHPPRTLPEFEEDGSRNGQRANRCVVGDSGQDAGAPLLRQTPAYR